MKRLLVTAGLVMAVLGGGLWWSLRRPPSGAPLDDQAGVFSLQASGPGRLATFLDTQTPLRTFHWLPPMADGALAAQVLSQNDRQRVAMVRGETQEMLLVLKPVGVSDGFWRVADLREAALVPGGTLLLLYLSGDPGSKEQSLALGLDLASQQIRWFCRGAFARMAVTPGAEAVYFYGGNNAIQRLALDQAAGANVQHPAPAAIDLPPDIPSVDDLLATGGSTFLVSHSNGLSRYRAKEGWTHFPAPEARGVACQGWKSSLARAGREIWWQAQPGQLVKVRPDGNPGTGWQVDLPHEDPFAPDASLLRLLGGDPAGCLWFALASPVTVPTPVVAAAPDAPAGEGNPAAGPGTDWGSYAAGGLDRLYRWNPAKRTLDRVAMAQAWGALNPPPGVQRPAAGQGVAPAAGALLAEGARSAWRLPLESLPMGKVAYQAR